MSLFTASDFPGAYDVPQGETAPLHVNDPVTLALSDGSVVQVFDTLGTALKMMAFMRQQRMSYVWGSDDVVIYAASSTKLFVCEATFTNQKLFSQFVPVVQGGESQFVHRSLSKIMTLEDALRTVGFCAKGVYTDNASLRADGTHVQVVDWKFTASPTQADAGSLLNDAAPLWYDFTP